MGSFDPRGQSSASAPGAPPRWARPAVPPWLCLAALALGAAAPPAVLREPVEPGLVAALTEDHRIFLEASPRKGEGLLSLARRLCLADDGGDGAAAAISQANGGARRLLTGFRYRVPYAVLHPELQRAAVRALFAGDRAEPRGWRHAVERHGGAGSEGLWQVAEWFTGKGENFRALRQANGLASEDLMPGATLLIPAELLLPAFRAILPEEAPPGEAKVASVPARPVAGDRGPDTAAEARAGGGSAPVAGPAPRKDLSASDAKAVPGATPILAAQPTLGPPGAGAAPASTASAANAQATQGSAPLGASSPPVAAADKGYRLDYGRDERGEYAVYRLRPGEALYSSVVVRFTGRLLAPDVNALAEEIAQRSGIPDVTDIAIGYPVKIPLELLQPEYLPPGDPRRQEYEAALAASARFGNQVRALGLAGVTVILDAGHGGRDVGASFSGVWESLYVYDIMLRVKTLLAAHTAARVATTVQDGGREAPEDRDVLSFSRSHRVLTDPPYPIEDAAVGTNLRWYLANSLFRRELARGIAAEKVVFVSLHADSLHPSLRGAMVYVPGAELRRGSFGRSGPVYASRAEYRERPRVSFSWQGRVRSEGLSRDLANHLIGAFTRHKLPVHPFKPVRERIIRRRSQYVPAVLRYSEVPAAVLVEVCNLANPEDRKLIQTRRHRQQLAEAIVEGLLKYYGVEGGELAPQVAAGAGK